jgi:hypothetical protein
MPVFLLSVLRLVRLLMERQRLRVLIFLRQGDNCALRGRRRLPNGRLQFEGSKDGGSAYTYFGTRESEMEIPVQDLDDELLQRIVAAHRGDLVTM